MTDFRQIMTLHHPLMHHNVYSFFFYSSLFLFGVGDIFGSINREWAEFVSTCITQVMPMPTATFYNKLKTEHLCFRIHIILNTILRDRSQLEIRLITFVFPSANSLGNARLRNF